MARLTLSEQVNQLASEKAELSASLEGQRMATAAATREMEAGAREIARLREIVSQLNELVEKNTKLEEKLKSADSMKEYYGRLYAEKDSELTQAHAMLDSVVGAPARAYQDDSGNSQQRHIITRLAGVFLSIAQS